jgi:sugar phosphate permease
MNDTEPRTTLQNICAIIWMLLCTAALTVAVAMPTHRSWAAFMLLNILGCWLVARIAVEGISAVGELILKRISTTPQDPPKEK